MAGREIMVTFAVGWALAVRGFGSWHGAPGSCRARERRDLTRTDEAIPYRRPIFNFLTFSDGGKLGKWHMPCACLHAMQRRRASWTEQARVMEMRLRPAVGQ